MADENRTIAPHAHSLSALAENFLNQYLQANPDTEFVRVCCHAAAQPPETKAVDAAAQACITEIQERVEITEPAQSPVIIRRHCRAREAAFLAGTTSAGKLLWTHSRNLALILSPEDAANVSTALIERGIGVHVEPITRAHSQVCAAELADLEHEAKRSLSQDQAQRYRLRRLKAELIANLLERR